MAPVIFKEDRKLIYEALFSEGCLVAPADCELPQHPEIPVKNLHVIKAMQSLSSMGHVKTQYNWRYYYYILTDSGLEYIREWLHLPVDVVPASHKRPAAPPSRMPNSFSRNANRGGDDSYRKLDSSKEGDNESPAQFRGGLGKPTPA